MLTSQDIERGLLLLNDRLQAMGVMGEILLCGGAVMCLVFHARQATKDVDELLEPSAAIRKAAAQVAAEMGWPPDWLYDAAKGFFSPRLDKMEIRAWSNLRVYAPTSDYMLAMKCVSGTFDSNDKDDVIFLIDHLGLTEKTQVFQLIEAFYPRKRIPAKAQFLVEEIFGE